MGPFLHLARQYVWRRPRSAIPEREGGIGSSSSFFVWHINMFGDDLDPKFPIREVDLVKHEFEARASAPQARSPGPSSLSLLTPANHPPLATIGE
jgi:hypothetical protein